MIHVELDVSNGMIRGSKINVVNQTPIPINFFFDFELNEDDEDTTEEDSSLRPIFTRSPLFSIDPSSNEIHCSICSKPHADLPWMTTYPMDRPCFTLSHEILPEDQRSALITRDAMGIDQHEGSDLYFLLHCSDESSITYRPLTIPRPLTNSSDHPLARLNGLWVGSYGGHGLELLHLKYCTDFSYSMVDEDGTEALSETAPHALVARKISGDPNVPHGQISFAAVQQIADRVYVGIGQSKSVISSSFQFDFSLKTIV